MLLWKKFKDWFRKPKFSESSMGATIVTGISTPIPELDALLNKAKESEAGLQKRIKEFDKLEEKFKTKFTRVEELLDKTQNLVYLGFFVLIIMVATMLLTYVDFLHKSDHMEYNLNETNTNIKNLENCLSISKWLNPKCFTN